MMLLIMIFALIFPYGMNLERSIKMSVTRVVAGGGNLGQFRYAWFVIPYRPNRMYWRLAITRAY
jgi:hypothetical protein